MLGGGTGIQRTDNAGGTLGCLVRRRPDDGFLYILSNAHVLTISASAKPQPQDGIFRLGDTSGQPVARLVKPGDWTVFSEVQANLVDAAIARLETDDVTPTIGSLGLPRGTRDPVPNMTVTIVGAASQTVSSQVRRLNRPVSIPYVVPPHRSVTYRFTGLVECAPFTAGGDSGAIVLDASNRVVGLHMAGEPGVVSYFCPIRTVLDLLSIDIVTDDALSFNLPSTPPPFPVVGATDGDVDTMARTMWGEARGEVRGGMQAVGGVILNRVADARWPNSIAAVCKQPFQFSCWNSNDPNLPKLRTVGLADTAFREAFKLARDAAIGRLPDNTGGANHYHHRSIRPSWALGHQPNFELGQHVFYKLAP